MHMRWTTKGSSLDVVDGNELRRKFVSSDLKDEKGQDHKRVRERIFQVEGTLAVHTVFNMYFSTKYECLKFLIENSCGDILEFRIFLK